LPENRIGREKQRREDPGAAIEHPLAENPQHPHRGRPTQQTRDQECERDIIHEPVNDLGQDNI
jgi:hypothetical protein